MPRSRPPCRCRRRRMSRRAATCSSTTTAVVLWRRVIPSERLDPASITKLMTAYAVFHALKDGKLTLKETVNVSEHAWKAEGSRTFVQVGTQVPVDVLIQGMIVQSGNDATIALAERVGGTEETFAALDEHLREAARNERLALRQQHRAPLATALHDGARHGAPGLGDRSRVPRPTTAGIRSASSPGTRSGRRTAMVCWIATRRSMG